MNDSRLSTLLHDLAKDVPERSDDEAVQSLRKATDRANRHRRVGRGVTVAAAAALVVVVAWAVSPIDDDETPVASNGGESALPVFAVDVTADLDAYTGILAPLVAVSTDGTTVTVLDPLNKSTGSVAAYATAATTHPVVAASIGPRGQSILLTTETPESSVVVQVDLASGEIERRWDDASGMVTATDHERVAYLQSADADGGQGVVIEDLRDGTRQVFNTPAAGPGLDGWLSWSSQGRLAVGNADGTVRILDPTTARSFQEAGPVMGPLFNADWAGPDSLIGTSDCCEPSPIVIVEVSTGSTERTATAALDVAATDTGGSPWGTFYIDPDGRLHGMSADPDIGITNVAHLQW